MPPGNSRRHYLLFWRNFAMTTPSRTRSRCGYTSGCWVTSTLPTIEVNICAKGSLELTTAMGAIERKEVLGFLLNMGFYLTQSCLCCFKFLCCHNGFVGILMINPVFLWNSALGLCTDHHALTSVIHHATGVLDILQHKRRRVMRLRFYCTVDFSCAVLQDVPRFVII